MFAFLCAAAESPELGQEAWVLTTFKAKRKPHLLGDSPGPGPNGGQPRPPPGGPCACAPTRTPLP